MRSRQSFDADALLSRRDLLHRCGMGFGALALADLMGQAGLLAAPPVADAPGSPGSALDPLAPKKPHFAAKAKRVIHLFMNGGPSHVDTFDPKPMLEKYHGQPLPNPNLRTERKTAGAFRSPFKFQRYGKSGIEVRDRKSTRLNSSHRL